MWRLPEWLSAVGTHPGPQALPRHSWASLPRPGQQSNKCKGGRKFVQMLGPCSIRIDMEGTRHRSPSRWITSVIARLAVGSPVQNLNVLVVRASEWCWILSCNSSGYPNRWGYPQKVNGCSLVALACKQDEKS